MPKRKGHHTQLLYKLVIYACAALEGMFLGKSSCAMLSHTHAGVLYKLTEHIFAYIYKTIDGYVVNALHTNCYSKQFTVDIHTYMVHNMWLSDTHYRNTASRDTANRNEGSKTCA